MWFKRITVKPGGRLSLQYHLKRKEKWTIVEGYGVMTLEKANYIVFAGDQISIPYRAQHRIANPSMENDLVILEIALGKPDEDDIIRVEDDYGRSR